MWLHDYIQFHRRAATQEVSYRKSKTEFYFFWWRGDKTNKQASNRRGTHATVLRTCLRVRWQAQPVICKYAEICIRTSPSLKESNPLGMRHTFSRIKEKKRRRRRERKTKTKKKKRHLNTASQLRVIPSIITILFVKRKGLKMTMAMNVGWERIYGECCVQPHYQMVAFIRRTAIRSSNIRFSQEAKCKSFRLNVRLCACGMTLLEAGSAFATSRSVPDRFFCFSIWLTSSSIFHHFFPSLFF